MSKPEKKEGSEFVRDGYDEDIGHYETSQKESEYNECCDEWEEWLKGKIVIKDDTINEIVLVLSHYIRYLDTWRENNWTDKVKALRDKLIEMGNDKLLGGGK